MKKVLFTVALTISAIFANANTRESFVKIESINPSPLLIPKATFAPLDSVLYSEVISELNTLTEFFETNGDYVSATMIDQWVAMNQRFFTNHHLAIICEKLQSMNMASYNSLILAEYKTPGAAFALSLFFGCLGVDRFYIGDVGLGVLKLLTAGGFGIWAFIDLFCISHATKQRNYEKISLFLTLV